jgi:hypothetical protein
MDFLMLAVFATMKWGLRFMRFAVQGVALGSMM